jgi:hypothetical protein
MAVRGACLVLCLVLTACPGSSAAGDARTPPPRVDVTAEDYKLPPLPTGHVVLKDAFGGAHAVQVEIAATPESTERGMMWRKELAAGKGMLFVFREVEHHGFWMKNTLIPLDMIFIGPDLQVVGVVENAQPRTLTSRSVGRPSKYVLEVPGGWSARAGIRAGATVELRLPPDLKVTR